MPAARPPATSLAASYRGITYLTDLQLDEFERVFRCFTDPPREDVALVRDVEHMMKCLGYGYRKVAEEELESLRQVIDPTDSGLMTFDAFVSVIGGYVAPPPDEAFLGDDYEANIVGTRAVPTTSTAAEDAANSTSGTSGRNRAQTILTGTGAGDYVGVVGRKRAGSLAQSSNAAGTVPRKRTASASPSNNLTAHRRDNNVSVADKTAEVWSTFRLFDRDAKGYISAGDLALASTRYCGSMLSERDCFFVVNTLKTGWGRDGLSMDDFTRAMLK